jgi:hypothetical protein
MTPPAALAAAVASCGYVCVECGSGVVRLDHAPALGWLPVAAHWPLTGGGWCPVLSGGPAARLASLDLLDSLSAAVALASYGEPVWHRRDLTAAL